VLNTVGCRSKGDPAMWESVKAAFASKFELA